MFKRIFLSGLVLFSVVGCQEQESAKYPIENKGDGPVYEDEYHAELFEVETVDYKGAVHARAKSGDGGLYLEPGDLMNVSEGDVLRATFDNEMDLVDVEFFN